MNNILLIIFSIFNAAGIFLYAWLSIILMQVVLCREAKEIDTKKLFSRSISLRLKLFRRSLGSNFYRGSILIWIACYIVIFLRVQELTGGIIPQTNSPRTIASMFLPGGIIWLYKYMGYESSLFR